MADNWEGWSPKAGATSQSTVIRLISSSGTGVTGKVASNLTASYLRQGGTRTAITLSDLAAVNSAYSSGGVKEIDATNFPGLYRLDLPDAAIATGVEWVVIGVTCSGAIDYMTLMVLKTTVVADVAAAVWAVATRTLTAISDSSGVTTLLSRIVGTLASGTHNPQSGDAYAVVNNGSYGNSALKSLIDALPTAAAIATAVWAAGTRTLTSISSLAASIASAVLDASAAAYNTANTIGGKINAAGAAADPLENDVPGSYASGTAGYVLGHLSDSGVTVISVLDGDDLTIRRGDTVTVNYTELGNLSARAALYFTLKQNLQGADSDARIQVTEAGGLVVLNGSSSGLTTSDASLTVTNAMTGAVTLVLKPNLTKQLSVMDGLRWDVQMVASDGAVTTLTEGDAEIVADVTRAVA